MVFYGTTWLRQDCARPAAHDFLSKIIRAGFICLRVGGRGFFERSALYIVVGLAVKIAIVIGFFYLVKALLPIELFSTTAIILAFVGVFLWFFELEGDFISGIIVSKILLCKMNSNMEEPVELNKDDD